MCTIAGSGCRERAAVPADAVRPAAAALDTGETAEQASPSALVASAQRDLFPPNPSGIDSFSAAVALTGDSALVARPGAQSVVEFTRSGVDWLESATIHQPDAMLDSQFGVPIARSGTTALIGASQMVPYGAAYVFVRTASGWTAQGKLQPPQQDTVRFGDAVALEGDTALIGAPGSSETNSDGAAYVFGRNQSSWELQAELSSDFPLDSLFGSAVALLGNTLAVSGGSGGSFLAAEERPPVHVFVRRGSAWIREAKLYSSDGSLADGFGEVLLLAPDKLYVGAPWVEQRDAVPGAVYEFTRSGTSWSETAKLVGGPPLAGADPIGAFGTALAADRDLLLIGMPEATLANGTVSGAIALFQRSGGGWQHAGTTYPAAPQGYDGFGAAVALSGRVALVGAPGFGVMTTGAGSGKATVLGIGLARGAACSSDGECSTVACSRGVCCESECNGGCQSCTLPGQTGLCITLPPATQTSECGAALCDGVGTECPETCKDCALSHVCSPVTGHCEPKRESGATCEFGGQCATGHCADGVCCDRACSDCEGCRNTFTGLADGSCGPVLAGLDPHLSCRNADSCTENGSCACVGNSERTPARCNGGGQCAASEVRNCSPFKCSDGKCTSSCRTNADCDSTAQCSPDNRCVALALCVGQVSRLPDGSEADCSPHRCDPRTGTCFVACTSSAQCVNGHLCSSAGKCVRVDVDDARGCSCRQPGNSRAPERTALVLFALLCGAARRRSASTGRRAKRASNKLDPPISTMRVR